MKSILHFRFAFIFVFLFSPMVWAQDHIASRAVLIDPTGQLTIEQASQGAFSPTDRVLTLGYTKNTTWLRLTLKPSDVPLILRARPTYMDHLDLYWQNQDEPGVWHRLLNGDTVPFNQRPLPYLSLAFPIDTQQQTTYYLRMQTTSTSLLNVEALSFVEMQRAELTDQFLQAGYYGFMLWMLLWAMADFLIYRQRVIGLFMVMQVAQIAYNSAVTGYLAFLFPTVAVTDYAMSVSVIAVVMVSTMFHRTLFGPFEPHRLALRAADVIILLGPLLLFMVFFGDRQLALQINGWLVLGLALLFIWLAFSAKRNVMPGLKALRIVYVILSLLILTIVLPALGLFESIEFYLGATSFQGLVSAFVMTMFLFVRSRRLQRESFVTRIQLAKSEQQLNDQKMRFEDQSRFVDMLTHELKTPVSVIRLTTDMLKLPENQRSRINRSIDTISNVIERCRLSLQLDHAQMSPVYGEVHLRPFVQEVIHGSLEPERIKIVSNIPVVMYTDSQLLAVVLHNLFDNALKYSPKGSEVSVSLQADPSPEQPEAMVEIVVGNALSPMSKPDARNIFDKYYRGVGSLGVSGSGLGLYLVRQLTGLLGGEIACKTQDEHIAFILRLPVGVPDKYKL